MRFFISYSHADEKHRTALETHLSALQNEGLIDLWHDRKINPGAEWANEIHNELHRCEVILLLVSPDFLASKYCYEIEMRTALDRHSQESAAVLPIILRPCDWQNSPFAKLQALPVDGRPVTKWRNRDEAFFDVAQGIRRLVRRRSKTPAATIPEDVEDEGETHGGSTGVITATATSSIDLLIDRDFDTYSDEDQRKLLDAIGHILGTGADLRVGKKRRGSVRIKLSDLTPAQAERLYWAIERGELEDHGVVSATLPHDMPDYPSEHWTYPRPPARYHGVDLASRITQLQQQLSAAQAASDLRTTGELLEELGSCYLWLSAGAVDNIHEAIPRFESALVICEELGDVHQLASVHNNLAFAHSLIALSPSSSEPKSPHHAEAAIRHYEALLPLRQSLKQPRYYGMALNDLAMVYAVSTVGDRFSNVATARSHFEMAMDVLKQFGRIEDVAQVEENISAFEKWQD